MVTAQNHLIQRLSYLFGSERALQVRRFSTVFKENISGLSRKDEGYFVILSGSKGEGISYPVSDYDDMFVYKAPSLSVRTTMREANQHNAPLMVPSESSPGYCLLMIPDKHRHEYGFCCDQNYLSSLQWKSYFMQKYVDMFPDSNLHGPCHSGNVNNNPVSECDIAHSLQCFDWPEIALEWVQRQRKHGWPSQESIKYIVNKGCHVVPVGDPESRDTALEWRISFSFAERTLIHTFSHIQFVVYNLLKLTLKRIINVHVPDTICSYFIKTTLFYCIENSDRTFWCLESIDMCYKRCIEMLRNFVDSRFCPSYFVNKTNLFKRKITAVKRRQLLPVLTMLLENGIRGTLLQMEESRIFSEDISKTDIETKDDFDEFKVHLPLIEMEIDDLYVHLGNSVPQIILTHDKLLESAHTSASRTLTSEQSRDKMLLHHRYFCIQTAVGLNQALVGTRMSNRYHYLLRQLMVRMYQLGTHYDVSSGRLRFATHLYMENLTKEAQKLLQDLMSDVSPFVLIKDRKFKQKSFKWHQKFMCDRGYSFARKHRTVVAEIVHFSPTDYQIIPTALQFLTIADGRISRHCFLDPMFYAFFLQGMCFLRERAIPSANNCIWLLQDQLRKAKFTDNDGLENKSMGFCLLGYLQMQLERYKDAGHCFIKAMKYAHRYNKKIGSKKIHKIDYGVIYLSVLLRYILSTH